MFSRIFIQITAVCILASCNSLERHAWQIADAERTNHVEIAKFLNHYKQDGNKDKYRAACFLVANMPNRYSFGEGYPSRIYDVKIVKADSLIQSLDYSFALRDTNKFLWDYSFSDFCEYILPYRIAKEPAEFYWKQEIPRWINTYLADSSNLITRAQQINRKIDVATKPEAWGNPQMGYTATMSGQFGKCDDRAILATMAMRSKGIPAAFELVPNWGSNNNGHSFCSVILPNDSVCVFQGANDNGESILLSQKAPKIYRNMFSEQRNTILYKHKDTEPIPPLFQDCNLLDVTSLHAIGQQDVTVSIQVKTPNKIAYLCVFTPREWLPIAYAKNEGNNTLFRAIGNGTNTNGFEATKGEAIGDGIVYLPAIYSQAGALPASELIIVSTTGIRKITPQTKTQTVRLHRKYPRLIRVIRFADQMTGGVFEGANKRDFSDATTLWAITDTPLSRLQHVPISTTKAFKYLRYRKPQGVFSIGEICAYSADGSPVKSKLISPDEIASERDLANICDGDPLTYYELPGGIDMWAGLEFERPEQIAQIGFCPRNDDNEISPGDEYELFYWDNAWISLDCKTATEYMLEYPNVPQGALLWLRNRTKGHEERPFTYQNGIQIWW